MILKILGPAGTQTLYKRFKGGVAPGRPPLQAIRNLHVRQAQEPLERGCLVMPKCSALRGPKATQPEVQFQQPAPAAPGDPAVASGIRHAVSPAAP